MQNNLNVKLVSLAAPWKFLVRSALGSTTSALMGREGSTDCSVFRMWTSISPETQRSVRFHLAKLLLRAS